ncbi:LysR substrate-binding domain-containing protein [Phenylobacterium sp.]|uniref:LysR substrate-binding domain-containing protein n=1 Tax=Phenylobacterium sp. TaxID=1871053 RepID=UPI002DF5F155|nr:LysR substrate-binding domain-containing protein [Phenylobacterium sp.]
MKPLPSLFALQALEAAVRLTSYSAAARELAVTQGAISQQIRKLEQDLGARLFSRQGNAMIPTPAALRLAQEIAGSVKRLRNALGEFVDGQGDPLVLSVAASFGARWLAPKLPRLLADPAGGRLDVRVEDRISNLAADGVDLAVRFGRGDWPEVEAARLNTECFLVVCTAAFAKAHRLRAIEDLRQAPLIDSVDRLWPILFNRHGLAPPSQAALVSNDSVLTLDAVARGVGAALVRASMVEDDLRAGKLVRPVPDTVPLPVNYVRPGRLVRQVDPDGPPPPDFGYFAVWRADSPKLGRIHALRDWLVAEARAGEAALGLGPVPTQEPLRAGRHSP